MEKAIPPDELALMKRWVDTWKHVTGPELERIKTRELRAMTEEEAFRIAQLLSAYPPGEIWIEPSRRDAHGLIQQQHLFQKARNCSR
jgi:hypothetical protein